MLRKNEGNKQRKKEEGKEEKEKREKEKDRKTRRVQQQVRESGNLNTENNPNLRISLLILVIL